MSPMMILREPVDRSFLKNIAEERYGDMVKAVVDIERNIMAIGGEMHADEEQMLLEDGSRQSNLWGINIYPSEDTKHWIEFDSMINIRPTDGNRSRGIDSSDVREKILSFIKSFIQ